MSEGDPDSSGSSSSRLTSLSSENEEESDRVIDDMVFVTTLLRKLGIASISGFLHEGLHYQALKDHPRAIRAFESARVDGAWIMNDEVDAELKDLNFSQRLLRLCNNDGADNTIFKLALQDSKASIGQLLKQELKGHHKRVAVFSTSQTSEQSKHLSNLHIAVHTSPGIVILSPPHATSSGKLAFQDVLLYETQLPPPYMPLIIPMRELIIAQERWRLAQRDGTNYFVPGSEVEVKLWATKPCDIDALLGENSPAKEAFMFLYDAIESSSYARENDISLEFATFQPLGGDGSILWKGHDPVRIELKKDLLKEVRGDNDTILRVLLSQVGITPEQRMKSSAFHPNRSHHFLIAYNSAKAYGYCIPASALTAELWTGDYQLSLPTKQYLQFRFDTSEDDWFQTVHQQIIIPFAESQRPHHDIPDGAVAENYVAAAALEPEEIESASGELKSILSGYPWWKIERWNRRAAHTGWGVYLPLSRESRIANVVWMGYRWSVEDKVRYFATQELPVKFRLGDGGISPGTPIILIRAISSRTRRAHWVKDFPTRVCGWRLDPGPFPCLYYVDCGSYDMNDVERSGLLFPSEYIDHDKLNDGYSKWLKTQGISSGASSGRDFLRKYATIATHQQAVEEVAYLTSLERCLRAPWTGFHVREGKDFDDAINRFFFAHVSHDEKPITWYTGGTITAKDYYNLTARELWQALADEWITNGIIKNPKNGINKLAETEELDTLGDEETEKAKGLIKEQDADADE
ncbi:hypothetical protein Q7P37_000191 [Cladosporium fusiforme]